MSSIDRSSSLRRKRLQLRTMLLPESLQVLDNSVTVESTITSDSLRNSRVPLWFKDYRYV